MENQHDELLNTLRKWTKIKTTSNAVESKRCDPDASKIFAITSLNRGEAQRIPSSILMPV